MKQTTNYYPKTENQILTIPNILSLFRICLIPIIIWLYLENKSFHWAGCVLILSGLTDIIDGFIAREFNMISNLGKILDPIADKLTQLAMLICLSIRYPLMLVPLSLLVIKELFMTLTGLQIIHKTGIVLGAHWHGKIATLLLYITIFIHIFWNTIPSAISNITIIGCFAMILLSFILYGIRNINILKGASDDNIIK